jgi:hypothetical protein
VLVGAQVVGGEVELDLEKCQYLNLKIFFTLGVTYLGTDFNWVVGLW